MDNITGSDSKMAHDEVFSDLQRWNVITSSFLIAAVMVTGSAANGLIIYFAKKKKIGNKMICPVLVASSIKNIIAISTAIPLTLVMIIENHMITFTTCAIQEQVSVMVLLCGLMFPAVLSIIQFDQVVNANKHIFNEKRVYALLILTTLVSGLLSLQPELQGHEHGCHFWTIVVDKLIYNVIYMICAFVVLSLLTMVVSYLAIVRHVTTHARSIEPVSTQSTQTPVVRINGDEHESDMSRGFTLTDTKRNYIPLKRQMYTAILKPMFCMVAINLLSWLPWLVLYIGHINGHDISPAESRVLALTIAYIPIASEPIIFLSFSTKGRKAIATLLGIRSTVVAPSASRSRSRIMDVMII